MKIYASLLPVFLLALWPSCGSDADENIEQKTFFAECSSDMMCTYQLESIVAFITDSKGNAVDLSSFRSRNLDTGKEYQFQKETGEGFHKGYHLILDDTKLHEVSKAGTPIEFVGYLNGREVVRQTYLVGHDCCHIRLISGELQLQLNKF